MIYSKTACVSETPILKTNKVALIHTKGQITVRLTAIFELNIPQIRYRGCQRTRDHLDRGFLWLRAGGRAGTGGRGPYRRHGGGTGKTVDADRRLTNVSAGGKAVDRLPAFELINRK